MRADVQWEPNRLSKRQYMAKQRRHSRGVKGKLESKARVIKAVGGEYLILPPRKRRISSIFESDPAGRPEVIKRFLNEPDGILSIFESDLGGTHKITFGQTTPAGRSEVIKRFLNEPDEQFAADDLVQGEFFELWHNDELIGLLNLWFALYRSEPGEHWVLGIRPENVFILKAYRKMIIGWSFAHFVGNWMAEVAVVERRKYHSVFVSADFISEGGEMFSRVLVQPTVRAVEEHKSIEYDWGY